jgi:DHA2 family multidrug resistance protein
MMSRVDARIMATVSFGAFAISYFQRSGYTNDAGFWDFVYPLLMQGVAMSTFFVSMLTISLDGIPPERIPSASGISNFTRITAGGFAASITTTLWDRREALHQSRLSDLSTAYNPQMQAALDHLHALGLTDPASYALLARTLASQAYLLASDDLFWISGWLSIAMIAVVWSARRAISGGGPPVAAD